MGVKFDLTVACAEILDSVIFMDKSPAYAAFKEEIEKILADFNKTKRFGDTGDIDVKGLVDNSADTLSHMQRAYLIWTFNEDYGKKAQNEMEYAKFLKLFVKSQEKALVAANGGSRLIDVTEVEGFIKKFLDNVSTQPDLFNSIKEFFAGYVYGYFFNYLTEQKVMKDYAEFIVCLGIMSNKISTNEAQKQKILPKMALLLNNDRFKYISGEIPLDVMFNIVYDRLEITGVTEAEDKTIREALRDYITSNYAYRAEDGLISDTVVTDIMTKLNGKYVCAADFVINLHKSSFDGVRTFLDGDKNDMGEYTVDKVLEVVHSKCAANHDDFYTYGRDAVMEVALSTGCKCYKYPLVYKEADKYWFADIYKELLFPAADKSIYAEVAAEDLPLAEYPFTDAGLRTNIIRYLGGLETTGYTVRTDKLALLDDIKNIRKTAKNDVEKRMLILEKLLYVISGNMDAAAYKKLVDDCIFNTGLYDEYIRYRMDCIFEKGVKSLETKKNLLDEINKIK